MIQTQNLPLLEIESLAKLKAYLLTDGICLSHEIGMTNYCRPFYSIVTQGIELEICNTVTVNTRINSQSTASIHQIEGQIEIFFNQKRYPAKILPNSQLLENIIPGTSEVVSDYAYIATDRINVWAVENCGMTNLGIACKFCDVAYGNNIYKLQNLDKIKYALNILQKDTKVIAKHIQVSGGTPLSKDWNHFLCVCEIAIQSQLPVSVMITPTAPLNVFDSLADLDISELAVNVEFSSPKAINMLTPSKINGWKQLPKIVSKWPENKVRSALIIGYEDEDTIIEGIKCLFDLGVVPMLSPFRSAPGTPMNGYPGPSSDFLFRLYMKAIKIAATYKSYIGPSCRYCQHNVMALPLKLFEVD